MFYFFRSKCYKGCFSHIRLASISTSAHQHAGLIFERHACANQTGCAALPEQLLCDCRCLVLHHLLRSIIKVRPQDTGHGRFNASKKIFSEMNFVFVGQTVNRCRAKANVLPHSACRIRRTASVEILYTLSGLRLSARIMLNLVARIEKYLSSSFSPMHCPRWSSALAQPTSPTSVANAYLRCIGKTIDGGRPVRVESFTQL